MINYFRASLTNVAPVGSGSTVDADNIPYAFTPVTLSAVQTALYSYLFPTSDRAVKLAYTDAYTSLLTSFRLNEVFTWYYPTIIYTLDDFNVFPYSEVDLLAVISSIKSNGAGEDFLAGTPVTKYSEMYSSGIPKMFQLAGIISAYAISLSP